MNIESNALIRRLNEKLADSQLQVTILELQVEGLEAQLPAEQEQEEPQVITEKGTE